MTAGHVGEPGRSGRDPLREIQLRAWVRNRGRQAELAGLVDTVRQTGTLPADQARNARAVIHQLIGSAGTFGHDRVSDTATRIQELLRGLTDRPRPSDVDALAGLVAEVGELLSHEPPAEDD